VAEYSLEIKQAAQKELDALDDPLFSSHRPENSAAGWQSPTCSLQETEGLQRPVAHLSRRLGCRVHHRRPEKTRQPDPDRAPSRGLRLTVRLKYKLGLRNHRHQPPLFRRNSGLPDHRSLTAMNWHAFRHDRRTNSRRPQKVRLAFDSRSAAAFRQVQHRRHRAQRVRQRHDRAPVQHRRSRAKFFPNQQFSRDFFGRRRRNLDSQQLCKWQ